MIFRIVNPTGDKIAGATYEKKSGALQCLISLRRAPVGFADGTAATPITGAPAAYCFYVHREEPRGLHGLVPRNIIGTSRFSTGRYYAVSKKAVVVEERMACKCKRQKRFRIIFKRCERGLPRFAGDSSRASVCSSRKPSRNPGASIPAGIAAATAYCISNIGPAGPPRWQHPRGL